MVVRSASSARLVSTRRQLRDVRRNIQRRHVDLFGLRFGGRPKAIAWLQPNFSSFDQMSFTFTGFTAKGRGACFGGEKNSLMRVPNPPKFDPHATARRLFTGPLGTGPELKKSFRLSTTPAPNDVFVKGASARSRTLIGRSMKNCFRLDQKLSGMRISGLTNFGTAE